MCSVNIRGFPDPGVPCSRRSGDVHNIPCACCGSREGQSPNAGLGAWHCTSLSVHLPGVFYVSNCSVVFRAVFKPFSPGSKNQSVQFSFHAHSDNRNKHRDIS